MKEKSIESSWTGLVYDDRFGRHDTGGCHPECAERLVAIIERLRGDGMFDRMVEVPVDMAGIQWVELVHSRVYIARVEGACRMGQVYVDSVDSAICPDSYDVALLAVGGVLNAVDMVIAGAIRNAFCAVRPPGHHAERELSMGFCLFNNIAIAAEYLLRKHGLKRIAIVDFDVHHGNGTQHSMECRDDVLFVSLHEDPASQYPGTGFASEVGIGNGEGYTLNLPMNPGQGDEVVKGLFIEKVLPRLAEFGPEFVLVSAGFDGSVKDPLGHLEISRECFVWMTEQLVEVAEKHCGGRLVSMLEGGYDLDDLAANVAGHVEVLMGSGGR